MNTVDLIRELGKVAEALDWAEQHCTRVDEANAAMHCNPRVFHSPLTSALHEARAGLQRVVVDLTESSPPAVPTAPSPSPSLSPPGPGSPPDHAAIFVRAASGRTAWDWAHRRLRAEPPPASCPRAGSPRCCTLSDERPLCHEALVAIGAEAER